ncbi:MAG: hypothetical protein CFE26_02715 [Verrucomicrobiales bacterium VVV1]|nr:MAG: hypothetical protein CFE26_02715 [Verrucomicrobiales bacterium VVV1]
MKIFTFRPLLWVLLISSAESRAQGYGEQPLRSNLSPLPYYATEGGREVHRFSSSEVNRYRIYDFYARQAAYYLANPADQSTLLPPFPGLDGGRRGHWGVTNEKNTTAFVRDQGPAFTTVTTRNGDWELKVLSGSAVLVYDTLRPGLKAVFPKGRLEVPEHAFDKGADRFGLSLKVNGEAQFQINKPEWTLAGKPVARYAGYYLHGDAVVLRWELGAGVLLERPSISISRDGKQSFLLREFEFLKGAPDELVFTLPEVIATSETNGGLLLIRGDAEGKSVRHLVSTTLGIAVHPEGGSLKLSKIQPNARLVIATWKGERAAAAAAEEGLKAALKSAVPPSSLITGGPSRFPQTMKVAGKLNADPAASGGAYEIDDVPVPSENPYHAPMTLSGIAFDAKGTAYLSTLVGDVWKVTGLSGNLEQIEWKRFASGLDLPLGIAVVEGVPFVNTRRNILKLQDLNGDGEADFIERFNQMDLPTSDATGHDLQRDAAGNFHSNAVSGIYRLSADGKILTKTGHGSRNPFGLGVRADGLALSDSSEGENNGTCTIFESDSPENATSSAKLRRILHLPRGVDNSPGSRLFLKKPRMGPIGTEILGVSFGAGTWYGMLRDVVDGTPQAAMIPMPGEFSSGACRLAVNPVDGQVFVAGLDGWGDYGVTEGCLHRIRYTGREVTQITGWKACRNGIELRFNHPISSPEKKNFFAQQWNVIDSAQTYGSPEYSVIHPEQIGHDRLEIRSITVLPDHHSHFLDIPAIQPSMCMQIFGKLTDAGGKPLNVDLYATLNRLHPDSAAAPPAPPGKPDTLRVPEKPGNGNTYQQLIEHFDKLAGRTTAARPVGPETPRPSEPVSFRWLKESLIEKQCLPCHMTGTQHDLSTYKGILTKVNLAEPAKSPILGMIGTKSMPPYPLPTVAPGMQQAVLDWIKAGAPE